MPYHVYIKYAEHESEGDKFYKVIRFAVEDSGIQGYSFAINHYGPRPVHIKLESASTGHVEVGDMETGSTAGVVKWLTKQNGGYKKNYQERKLSFASLDELKMFAKSNFGSGALSTIRRHLESKEFAAGDVAVGPSVFVANVVDLIEPSTLHESANYGTW